MSTIETTTTAAETKKSFRIKLEKLDGGFISDITGKRKIHRDEYEVSDTIDFNNILKSVDEGEYHLNIDFMTQEQHIEHLELMNTIALGKEEQMSLQEAKESGLIETEKFNPNKSLPNDDEWSKEIRVNIGNAYSAERLRNIDWKMIEEKMPMTNAEKCKICGMNKNTMYTVWNAARKGKATFNIGTTRVAMTILAKYYEAHLGLRTSTKDQLEKLKEDMLATLRELELAAGEVKFIKSGDVIKKIAEMRKQLL